MLGAMVRAGTGCREPWASGSCPEPGPRQAGAAVCRAGLNRPGPAPGKGKLLDAAARRPARHALGLSHRADPPQGEAVPYCNRRELPQEHAGSRRQVDRPRLRPPAGRARPAGLRPVRRGRALDPRPSHTLAGRVSGGLPGGLPGGAVLPSPPVHGTAPAGLRRVGGDFGVDAGARPDTPAQVPARDPSGRRCGAGRVRLVPPHHQAPAPHAQGAGDVPAAGPAGGGAVPASGPPLGPYSAPR